ncbi:MAG: hypothetical protein ACRD1G_17690, partial [Acidimicrobiales bacterium]
HVLTAEWLPQSRSGADCSMGDGATLQAAAWHDRGMAWVVKHRSWILAVGLLLLLLGPHAPDPGTDVRSVASGLGGFLVFLAVLGILLAIPMAVKARHEAHRPPRPD